MDQVFVTADFNAFLAAYLPFVPKDSDVDACFERMRNGNGTENEPLIKPIQITRELQGCGEMVEDRLSFHFAGQIECLDRPDDNENNAFAKLDSIAKVIGESRVEGRKRRYKLFDCPNASFDSDIAACENEIDACFVPDEFRTFDEKERLTTSNIAVACIWKLEKDEKPESNRQMVLANIQITSCDVCRMFSHGIGIDGNELKFWYFSRSHSAVSEPVDYIQNPKFLIRAFMSFMFATPEEMGYDPTITRHSDGHFTYKVAESPRRYFRSIDCISEVRSDNITGRMTHVWSVKEVDSMSEDAQFVSDHTYVLKDVWLEETARTEKEIQSDIFDDIERFWDSNQDARNDRENFRDLRAAHEVLVTTGEYKKYFLTIEVEATEQVTKKAVSNEIACYLFIDEEISSVRDSKSKSVLGRRKAHLETAQIHPAEPEKPIARDVTPKKQYRVVFKEKCEAVGRLKTLGEVFDVVKQILIPLQLMFCAGWVHRDISSGNILAYKPTATSDWIAKLSDLEYAKRFPPAADAKPHKDPKTGTAYFMPTEILSQKYIYEILPTDDDRSYMKGLGTNRKTKTKELQYGVIHDFQHDLECLWWLILWSMTFRVDHGPSQKFARPIFANRLHLWKQREEAFTRPIRHKLEEALIGPGAPLLAEFMEFERLLQNKEYKERQVAGLIREPSSYITVHMHFQELFQQLYDHEDRSWRSIKLRTTSSDPSAPDKSKLESSSNQVETGQNSGTEDIPSTSGSGRIEQPESLGKRPRSLSKDEEWELDPSEASDQDEDDRPRKLMRLA